MAIGNRQLEIGEFVPAALKTARSISVKELQDPHSLEPLYRTQGRMMRTLGTALPLETELKDSLVRQLGRLDYHIARYEHTPEIGLPTLDPSFLAWKTKMGFPAFSIFHLDSDAVTFQFLARGARGGRSGFYGVDGVPKIMRPYYFDEGLKLNLEAYCADKKFERLVLTSKYGGVMPDGVRETIHKYLDPNSGLPRFDEIVIVADAPDDSWKVVGIPKKDPLVIGIAFGLLWLIAAYDLTPIESFVQELYANSSGLIRINN